MCDKWTFDTFMIPEGKEAIMFTSKASNPEDEYNLLKLIGSGTYGEVYMATRKRNKNKNNNNNNNSSNNNNNTTSNLYATTLQQ
jgi:fructose 1,6-bisphosphatase